MTKVSGTGNRMAIRFPVQFLNIHLGLFRIGRLIGAGFTRVVENVETVALALRAIPGLAMSSGSTSTSRMIGAMAELEILVIARLAGDRGRASSIA